MYPDLSNKKIKSNNNVKKGYTLIEVLISVMFFAIIAVGLSLPFSNSIYLTVDNKNINTANNLARSYLKDTEAVWRIQEDFKEGTLINIDNTYTNNGIYNVTVNSQNICLDENNEVMIRRVNIQYKDSKGNVLTNIFYDYSRPGKV